MNIKPTVSKLCKEMRLVDEETKREQGDQVCSENLLTEDLQVDTELAKQMQAGTIKNEGEFWGNLFTSTPIAK